MRAFPILILLCASLLAGCSTTAIKIANDTNKVPTHWPDMEKKLNQFQHWKVKGKLGFRTTDKIDSAIINNWEQKGSAYQLDLSSALFGLGATRLQGDNQFLVIQRAGEKPLFSAEPENLMKQETGWPLPLAQIPFWVKGLPAPTSEFKREFAKDGKIHLLEQDKWLIEYGRFKRINGLDLPGKIKLPRDQVRITFIIQQWTPLDKPTS